MRKIKYLILFIFIAALILVIGIGIINYDKIITYLGYPTRGLEYTLNEESTAYSVNKGKMKDINKLIIPATYKDLPVTVIEESAFMNCISINEVIIPEGITYIGADAFRGCKGLQEIKIPNSVVAIGSSAFFGCSSLKSYSSPFSGGGDPVNNFIGYVFGAKYPNDNGSYVSNSLETINITDNTKAIEQFAFTNITSLKNVNIIATHKQVLANILMNCTNLESLTCPMIFPAMAFLFGGTTPVTLKYINFNDCEINVIYGSFFKDCKGLTSVNIPESIEIIDSEAFKGCINLTNIFIPKSVYLMGNSVFDDCLNLTINCEVLSKPTNWSDSWNPDNRPVAWGASLEE